MYDLAAQRSRASALEAELKCLKANIGPSTVAPVQPDDIASLEATTAMQMTPSRPVTPIADTAHALTWNPYATDTSAEYSYRAASMSALRPPYLSSVMDEPTAQYTQPQMSDLGCNPGFTHQSDTLSRQPEYTFSRSLLRSATAVTSMLPCQPAYTPTHTTTRVRPPSTDDVMTSALPRPPTVPMDDVLTSALFDSHGALTDQAYTHTPPHSQSRTFSRSFEPACTQSTMTSALPRPPAALGDLPSVDDTIQRPADRVDAVICTHTALNSCWQICQRRRLYIDSQCRCRLYVHRLRQIYMKKRILFLRCQRTGTQICRFT